MEKSVMIVDDDADDIALFQEAIEDINQTEELPAIAFAAAYDAQEALDMLQHIQKPDYIFLDIRIPKLSAKQFLMRLKSDPRYVAITVVLYTTFKEPNLIKTLFKLGVADYFRKPSTFEELKKIISAVLSRNYSRVNQPST